MRVEGMLQERGTEVKRVLDALRPRMLAVLARYQIPSADGEDLVQEAILVTLERWEQIDNVPGWLLSVLRYRCSTYQRHRLCWKRLVQTMDPDELQAIAIPLDPPQELCDIHCDLQKLVRNLDTGERRLLVLRFAQDLGRSEVASRIGCHPANVTKVLRRILIRLRAAAAPRSPL